MACRVKEEMISQLPYTTAIFPEDHKLQVGFVYRVAQLATDGGGLLARVCKSGQGKMVCISENCNWLSCRQAHLEELIMHQSTREVLLIRSPFVIGFVTQFGYDLLIAEATRDFTGWLIRQRSFCVIP